MYVLPHWDRSYKSNFSISPIHSILTPSQPVLALTLQRQAPGRVATEMPISKPPVWLDPGKIPAQAGFEAVWCYRLPTMWWKLPKQARQGKRHLKLFKFFFILSAVVSGICYAIIESTLVIKNGINVCSMLAAKSEDFASFFADNKSRNSYQNGPSLLYIIYYAWNTPFWSGTLKIPQCWFSLAGGLSLSLV